MTPRLLPDSPALPKKKEKDRGKNEIKEYRKIVVVFPTKADITHPP